MTNHIKQKAERNKTITLTPEEQPLFTNKLLTVDDDLSIEKNILNKTVNVDLLTVIDFLPKEFADLIIIDPPYNLSKNYNGLKFNAMNSKNYLEYLQSWFPKIVRCLKSDGSLYICGDWRCTAALQQVMEENLYVMNRITWQREKGRGANSNWKNGMEDIWFGVKDKNNYRIEVRKKILFLRF
jgi:site-specific DNA-methyltransferase (adenine-specific)